MPRSYPSSFLIKNLGICSGAAIGKAFSPLNNSDSRPSNFLFQIARGLGLHSVSAFFSSKKRTSLRRLLQRQEFSNNIRFKTLRLFVPNSKRLGGYTQRVHFFLKKSAHHSKDFFKTDHSKATRQKEPGHSYIRALFDK